MVIQWLPRKPTVIFILKNSLITPQITQHYDGRKVTTYGQKMILIQKFRLIFMARPLINGVSVQGQIDDNTSNISTNTSNISTNALNISAILQIFQPIRQIFQPILKYFNQYFKYFNQYFKYQKSGEESQVQQRLQQLYLPYYTSKESN